MRRSLIAILAMAAAPLWAQQAADAVDPEAAATTGAFSMSPATPRPSVAVPLTALSTAMLEGVRFNPTEKAPVTSIVTAPPAQIP